MLAHRALGVISGSTEIDSGGRSDVHSARS
jgi:hypothetical protein